MPFPTSTAKVEHDDSKDRLMLIQKNGLKIWSLKWRKLRFYILWSEVFTSLDSFHSIPQFAPDLQASTVTYTALFSIFSSVGKPSSEPAHLYEEPLSPMMAFWLVTRDIHLPACSICLGQAKRILKRFFDRRFLGLGLSFAFDVFLFDVHSRRGEGVS